MNAQTKVTGAPAVYQAINEIQGELAKIGIAKDRSNQQQGYKFRGIDDVYAALSPLLAKHGLCVIPRIIDRQVIEKTNSKGNALFYVTVRAEFDFVAAVDGSVHTAATFGEAMDSGDKATNKAMSAAYKYAAFMTFAIPTEGNDDAEAHEVAAQAVAIIDDAQFAQLVTLAEQTSTDAKAFCQYFKVGAVNQLPATQFEKAKAMLEKKLKEPA